MLRALLFASLLAGLAGCDRPGQQPDWASRRGFVESGFFSGRVFHGAGGGGAIDDARLRSEVADKSARSNLADVLLDYSQRVAGGEGNLARQLWDEGIKLVVALPLEERWISADGRTEYALAALPLDRFRAMVEGLPWLSRVQREAILKRSTKAFDELEAAYLPRPK